MNNLPLSYINQFAYCPRRFWYMYVQGQMAENVHVLRGNLHHQRVDTPGYETDRRASEKVSAEDSERSDSENGVLVHRRVYVVSHRLGITGICDLVEEYADGTLVPVEYKQGRRGKWMNDRAQLCAQALCLEEMTGRRVERGQIFYFGSRRRTDVEFTSQLRATTEQLLQEMKFALAEGEIPPHTEQRQRCRGCSLIDICLPEEYEQLQGSPAF